MKSDIAPVLQRVRLADVKVDQRLRPVSQAGVQSILDSVAEIGRVKDPVHVRKTKAGLVLLAGGHRLAAYGALGIEEADAWVWSGITNDHARLIEIDDNLAGAEMGPLDTAVFLAARKAVYERLHPETKQGVAGALARHSATDTMSVASFATTTAEKFGLSERHVFRMIAVGSSLSHDELRWLRASKAPIRLADLQALAKIGDRHERSQVCIGLSNGAKSAADALRAHRQQRDGEAPVNDPVEAAFIALSKVWARAPKEARRRFVAAQFDEVEELLNDEMLERDLTGRRQEAGE